MRIPRLPEHRAENRVHTSLRWGPSTLSTPTPTEMTTKKSQVPFDCTSRFSSPRCSLSVVWSSTKTGTDANRRLTLHTVRVADVHLCHLSVADAQLHKKHISLIAKTEKRLPHKRHTLPWGPTGLDTSSGWEHNHKIALQCGAHHQGGEHADSSAYFGLPRFKFDARTRAAELPTYNTCRHDKNAKGITTCTCLALSLSLSSYCEPTNNYTIYSWSLSKV